MEALNASRANVFAISEFSPRILLGSDSHQYVTPARTALLKAGFRVDLASDYSRLELLWAELRHEVVLFDISLPESIETATETAVRIKRKNATQFIAYLTDRHLKVTGLIGDAIFARDARALPTALRAALDS
jgi:DNA-binding response OmpR family regulator